MEQLRLDVGITGYILSRNYEDYFDILLTEPWVQKTWEFCSKYGVNIPLSIESSLLQRQNDRSIMEILLSSHLSLSHAELQWFNKCWIYLKVFFVSDTTTSDGLKLRQDLFQGKKDEYTHTNYLWTLWGIPLTRAWTSWRRIL